MAGSLTLWLVCRQEALRIKSEANKLFVASKYTEALQLYTLSLNKNPFDPAVWANRACSDILCVQQLK